MSDQKTGTIRVVAAIADKKQVVLYKEDGDQVILNQGDHRLQALLDEIIPITARGEVAVVSLDKFSVYADFEKATNGIVRFFKVARQKLGSLLGTKEHTAVNVINIEFTDDISPEQLTGLMNQVEGHLAPVIDKMGGKQAPRYVPGMGIPEDPSKLVAKASVAQPEAKPQPTEKPALLVAVDMEVGDGEEKVTESVVERITPVGNEDEVQLDETVVAVIGDTLIPDVDKLQPYILHAVKTNSTQAVENFLKRVAAIIKHRAHSVIDLMRFLERGDLPLADDGSIVAYKILRKTGDGFYVDCHTGKVKQRVGSYVCVDEKLVDPDRRNECSNGLHIARRGYLGNFDGDVCVLCKIEPEDVMVVPHNDPNKVRVKGYHILAELSEQSFRVLKANRPMTEEEKAQITLLDAIRGRHIHKIEEVRIHGQKGNDVRVTPLAEPKAATKAIRRTKAINEKKEVSREEKRRASALDDPNAGLGVVEPREINKRVNQEIQKSQGDSGAAAAQTAKARRDRNGTVNPDRGKLEVTPSRQKVATQAKKEVNPASGKTSKKETKTLENKAKSSVKPPQEKAPKTSVKSPTKEKAPDAAPKPSAKDGLSPEQMKVLDLYRAGEISQSEAAKRANVSRRTIDRWDHRFPR